MCIRDRSLPGYLTMMASHNAAEGTATSYSLLDIVSTMAWGLGLSLIHI